MSPQDAVRHARAQAQLLRTAGDLERLDASLPDAATWAPLRAAIVAAIAETRKAHALTLELPAKLELANG